LKATTPHLLPATFLKYGIEDNLNSSQPWFAYSKSQMWTFSSVPCDLPFWICDSSEKEQRKTQDWRLQFQDFPTLHDIQIWEDEAAPENNNDDGNNDEKETNTLALNLSLDLPPGKLPGIYRKYVRPFPSLRTTFRVPSSQGSWEYSIHPFWARCSCSNIQVCLSWGNRLNLWHSNSQGCWIC
jgi:hypothetical protein